MFKQILIESTTTLCVVIALFTALTIFVTILWRALRMTPGQVARFENLPFDQATPAARHETQS